MLQLVIARPCQPGIRRVAGHGEPKASPSVRWQWFGPLVSAPGVLPDDVAEADDSAATPVEPSTPTKSDATNVEISRTRFQDQSHKSVEEYPYGCWFLFSVIQNSPCCFAGK